MEEFVTMDELEKARKRAQRREWFQDKKCRIRLWIDAHKTEIITYGPIVISIAAGSLRKLARHNEQVKAQNLKDLYVYSRSTGHYIKMKRKLKTNEWAEFNRRKRLGEDEYVILQDFKAL
jgi:hypothetical protein